MVCGSFRRGSLASGDIDVLICPPDSTDPSQLLLQVIQELTIIGFLTDHLTMPHLSDKDHYGDSATYMGVCRLLPDNGPLPNQPHQPAAPPPYRRIDIKAYCSKIFPYALLYFTGPEHFNRKMRYYADKRFDICLSDDVRKF